MQLRIFFKDQSTITKEMNTKKIKQKILTVQYSMSFPGIYPEVLYILVSINLHIGKDMYKGHYVCDLLD